MPLTERVEFVNECEGGLTVATSCAEAAVIKVIASDTLGRLRTLSLVNSIGLTGSWSEGKSIPVPSHTVTMVSTEEEIMSRRALSSVNMMRKDSLIGVSV